jgi:hypothetical protein
MHEMANELSPGPDVPRNKDKDLARSLFIGCGIVFVLYLIGSALIAWFWLHP